MLPVEEEQAPPPQKPIVIETNAQNAEFIKHLTNQGLSYGEAQHAVNGIENDEAKSVRAGLTGDRQSDEKLATVQPDFGARVKAWRQEMISKGYDPVITEGGRTKEYQQHLYDTYKSGGSLAAPPGFSYHEWGRAVDWANREKDGSLNYLNHKAYTEGRELAKKYELFGGVKGDEDHLQDARYKTYKDLPKDEYQKGVSNTLSDSGETYSTKALNETGKPPTDPGGHSVHNDLPVTSTPAPIRYLNPSGMWDGPSARKFGSFDHGIIQGGNHIARFDTPEQGAAAQFDLLNTGGQKGYLGMSVLDAVRKWTDNTGGEAQVEEYAQAIAKAGGLRTSDPITTDFLKGNGGIELAKEMAVQESGKPFPITDAQWKKAQDMAYSGVTGPSNSSLTESSKGGGGYSIGPSTSSTSAEKPPTSQTPSPATPVAPKEESPTATIAKEEPRTAPEPAQRSAPVDDAAIQRAEDSARAAIQQKSMSDAEYSRALNHHMIQELAQQHLESLPPGDTRVQLQPDSGMIAGTHFVPNDIFHDFLLKGQTPESMHVINQVQDAIAGKQDVFLNYGSAIHGEQGTPTGSQREQAQSLSPAKSREQGLSDIQEAGKHLIPTYMSVAPGKPNTVTVGGVSPDKILENSSHIAHELGPRSPYSPIMDNGVAQVDLRGYLHNVSCYSSDTEIWTRRGPVLFPDLLATDDVATRNPVTHAWEWQRPTSIINESYSGKMIHFKAQSLDILVTPEHRMLVRGRSSKEDLPEGYRRCTSCGQVKVLDDFSIRSGKPEGSEYSRHTQCRHCLGTHVKAPKRINEYTRESVLTAEELYSNYNHHVVIPVTSEWSGIRIEEKIFNIEPHIYGKLNVSGHVGVHWNKRANKWTAQIRIRPRNIWLGNYDTLNEAIDARKSAEITYSGNWRTRDQYAEGFWPKTVVSGEDFCALVGSYLSEGSCSKGANRSYRIVISQLSTSKGFKPYKELIERIQGFSGYSKNGFNITRKSFYDYFVQFGHSHEKFIPDEIMNATPDQIRIFLHYFTLGDGHVVDSDPNSVSRNTSRKAAGERHSSIGTSSKRLANQLVELWQKVGYSAYMSTRPGSIRPVFGRMHLCREFYDVSVRFSPAFAFKANPAYYSGTIHCVTVPNGIVYVRRYGKPVWCGNSGYSGAGDKALTPLPGHEEDVPQTPPNFIPYKLGKPKASFWNMAINGPDSKMSENSKRAPKSAKAFELSRLNEGYAKQGYTNALAHSIDTAHGPVQVMTEDPANPKGQKIPKLDKSGKPVKELWSQNTLHSGFERINIPLIKTIHEVGEEGAPPIHASNELATKALQEKGLPPSQIVKAGFLPGDTIEAKGERERISAAAVRTGRGAMYTAPNHHDAVVAAMDAGEPQDPRGWEHGYTTIPTEEHPDGRFLPREEVKKAHGEKENVTHGAKAHFMPDDFHSTSPEDFIKSRDKTTRAGYLSPLSPEDIKDHRLYVSKEGTVGAAVDPKGDVQNVFNNGGPKGAGADAVAHAISQGGNTLDAFDNYLPKLYRQFGFQETGRMKFNPDYAPHGWDYAKDDNPDVVFMAHKGYPSGGPEAAIERAKGDKNNWIKNERSDKYEDDYDTAKQSSRRAVQRGGTEVSGVHGETRGTPSNLPGEASLSEAGEGHRGFANGDDQGEAYQTGQGGSGIEASDSERLGAYSQALQEHRNSSDRIDKAFRQGGKPHAIDVAEEESAKQIPALRELAKSRGELLPPMDRASDAHGSEHQVWFSDDGKTATKETYYINDPAHGERKRFGAVPTLDASDVRDATPHEYLDRIGISNEMGRKTRVVGVVDQGNGETRIRTEEPTISDAVGHPSMDDISDYMAKRGFEPKEWTSWYNPETKVLASDAQPKNFLKTDHGIYPVDTMLRHADSIATPLTDADRLKKNEQQRAHLEKQQAKLDTTKPEEDMAWEIMASKIHDLEREHQRLTESVKSGSDRDLTSEPPTEHDEAYGNKAQFMPMGGEKAESYEKAKKKGYVFTGPDKQHRFEIDDSKSSFIKPVSDSPWDSTPLKNVLKHPSLYKEYPQLAEIPVSVGTDPGDAAYFQSATHPRADFMGVLNLSPDADKADVIHEVQHIIQRIEGRPSYGSSPDIEANAITPSEYKMLRSASGKDFDEIEPPLSKDQWEQEGSPNGTFSKYLSNLKNRKNRYIEAAGDHVVPTARYWSNSGEVEAREAARRSDMTPEQRLSSPPDLENSGPLPDALNPAINAPERYQPMMKKAAQYMPGELSPKNSWTITRDESRGIKI